MLPTRFPLKETHTLLVLSFFLKEFFAKNYEKTEKSLSFVYLDIQPELSTKFERKMK